MCEPSFYKKKFESSLNSFGVFKQKLSCFVVLKKEKRVLVKKKIEKGRPRSYLGQPTSFSQRAREQRPSNSAREDRRPQPSFFSLPSLTSGSRSDTTRDVTPSSSSVPKSRARQRLRIHLTIRPLWLRFLSSLVPIRPPHPPLSFPSLPHAIHAPRLPQSLTGAPPSRRDFRPFPA